MPTERSLVLLVTSAELAEGEPGAAALDAELAARGIASAWVCWDDPTVDWSAAGLVAVRSPWDYPERCADFLAWARRAAAVAPMLNGPEVFAWNVDKGYLVELADLVTAIPTRRFDDPDEVAAYVASMGEEAVVKPATGVGGAGLTTLAPGGVAALAGGPWVVQPVVASVRTEGEHSLWVIEGQVFSQVTKRPAGAELRVHEEFGGVSRAVPIDPDAAGLATEAMGAAGQLIGRSIDYGRVDLMRLEDGRLAVSELEVTEPGLYLDVAPENAGPFADLVERRLAV